MSVVSMRDFIRIQLKRISAHWPLQATPEALDEYMRVLRGYTELEIAEGIDRVIDTYGEMAAPKPTHIRANVAAVAKVRRRIPPTEEERDELGLRARDERLDTQELADLERRIFADPALREEYDSVMRYHLEMAKPAEGFEKIARKVFHPAVLRIVAREIEAPEQLTLPEGVA